MQSEIYKEQKETGNRNKILDSVLKIARKCNF